MITMRVTIGRNWILLTIVIAACAVFAQDCVAGLSTIGNGTIYTAFVPQGQVVRLTSH